MIFNILCQLSNDDARKRGNQHMFMFLNTATASTFNKSEKLNTKYNEMFEILLPERSPLIHQSQHQIPSFVNGRVFPINCTIKCQAEF